MNQIHPLFRKYADGGAVTEDAPELPGNRGLDLSRVSPAQLAALQKEDPAALQRGVARFAGAPVAPQTAVALPALSTAVDAVGLQQMLNRYQGTDQSQYADALKEAQARASKESDNFNALLERSMQQQTQPPSKAEMYFRLAAAFGAPTKTGSFGENLVGASSVMADQAKAEREASLADMARRQGLGMQIAQARMGAAKGEVDTLRQLTAEEMKDKRAVAVEAMKEYLASGKPQSEAGKAALDAGFKQGTPQYAEFVQNYVKQKLESGDMYKAIMADVAQQRLGVAKDAEARAKEQAAKLSPTEMKMKSELQDTLGQTAQAYDNLQRALQLNDQTFGNTYADKAQRFLLEQTNPQHPKVVATREMENLLAGKALEQLRSTFGGNPTEGERAILLGLQGIEAKSPEERKVILENTRKAMQNAYKRHKTKLADIEAGKYRTVQSAAPAIDMEQ